jgi:C1A family cysteine protease
MKKVYVTAVVVVAITLYAFVTNFCVYGAEPRIEDQGNTPLCGVYSVCNAVEYQMQLKGLETPENGFSKEWLWEKCAEREDLSDGIDISTALDIAVECGLCPAEDYGTSNEDEAAAQYKITTYSAIDFRSFKDNLNRYNVIIIESQLNRENWKDGIIEADTEFLTEGHGTFLIDYDEITEINGARDYYVGVNSWGEKWGFGGKYYMKYNFPYIGVVGAYTISVK